MKKAVKIGLLFMLVGAGLCVLKQAWDTAQEKQRRKTYKVEFFSGYENKKLIGLSSDDMIMSLPDFEETLYPETEYQEKRDISPDIIAYYDKKGEICEAVQFVNEETDVYVNGVQLMRIPEKDVIPTLKKMFPHDEGVTDGENYTYLKYSLNIFVTEGQVGGVMIGKKNYFDFMKEDLEDIGHSGLRKF